MLEAKIIQQETSHKTDLKTSNALLCISVGQPYHEEHKLTAAINLINQLFHSGKCTVMLADSLQRYNLLHLPGKELSLKEAHQIAHIKGNEWVDRNQSIINNLKIPYQIKRWNDFLKEEEYQKKLQFIENLIENDLGLSEAIQQTVNFFVGNRVGRHLNKQYSVDLNMSKKAFSRQLKAKIKPLSTAYLKEEMAVMLLWEKYNFHFTIYPTPINQPMRMICDYIRKENPHLLQELTLAFETP